MQLVTFERREPVDTTVHGSMGAASLGFEMLEGIRHGTRRLGAILPEGPYAGAAVDLNHALAVKLAAEDAGAPEAEAVSLLPPDLPGLLRRGPAGIGSARLALDFICRTLERYDAPDVVAAGIVVPRRQLRLCAPLGHPGKIVSLSEAADGAVLVAPSSVCGPEDEIRLLPRSRVECAGAIAAVIGTLTRHVGEPDALSCVAGFMSVNEVTAVEHDGAPCPPALGRSCDGFTPTGPALLTSDEVPAPDDVTIRLTRSGEVVDERRMKEAGVGLAQGIARVSRLVTLEPGDLVVAGPARAWRGPPLRDGDVVEVDVEGVGRLVNYVRAAR
jgi:hypothetical protein